jgi:enhancer of polycomb-like protein
MRNLRMNLDMSRALLEWLQRRERRKRDILQCDIDTQLLQLKLRHDAPRVQAAPESAPAGEAELRTRAQASDPAASDLAPAQSNGLVVRTMGPPPQDAAKREKKRRRDGRDRRAAGGAELAFVPPPQLSEPQMHFLTPNLRVPGFNLPAAVRGMRGRTRFGRGGRLLFDRVHPITREPFALPDVVLPPRRALPPVPLLIAPAPVAPAPAATKLDGPAAASAEVAPMET